MNGTRAVKPPPPSPREAALEVVRTLDGAGFTAYFAGGCVRDRLMRLEPKDYDVVTDARPKEVARLFRRAHSVGESFGVMLVRIGGRIVEVATFRTDGVYADGRHPAEVAFSDAEHDARRRDFTINGMFEDPLRDEIIDHVGGRADLAAKVIRAIGDPGARLDEDHLRMLRAIRFAARFEFDLHPDTAEAIRARAGELSGVSRERVGQEIRWMLADPNRAVAAWEMQYLGVDAAALDEPHVIAAPQRLGRLPENISFGTALAAWNLDRHGPGGDAPAARARRWGRALILSRIEERAMSAALEVHLVLSGPFWSLGVAAQKRLAAGADFDQGLLLLKTEDPQAFVDIRRRVVDLARTGLAPVPLITGDDLLAAGLSPGPAFKRILEGVYDAQLEGSLETPEEALNLARVLAGDTGT